MFAPVLATYMSEIGGSASQVWNKRPWTREHGPLAFTGILFTPGDLLTMDITMLSECPYSEQSSNADNSHNADGLNVYAPRNQTPTPPNLEAPSLHKS